MATASPWPSSARVGTKARSIPSTEFKLAGEFRYALSIEISPPIVSTEAFRVASLAPWLSSRVRLAKVEQVSLPDLTLQPLIHNSENEGLVRGSRVLGDGLRGTPRPLSRGRDGGVGVSLRARRTQAWLVGGTQCDCSRAGKGWIRGGHINSLAFPLFGGHSFALVTGSKGSVASFHMSSRGLKVRRRDFDNTFQLFVFRRVVLSSGRRLKGLPAD
nr:hypothetical protein Iba_chr02fCG6710 [Ipomoea batatas]